MTVHRARVLVLAAVLVGITALSPYTRVLTQQTVDDLQLDELRALAEQGNANAQTNLGVRYANGQGVPQDDTEAVRWYRLAANQGNAVAQTNLGLLYDNGEGVPQDDTEAARWCRLAADQGLAQAQANLGLRYANGQGVPQDLVSAHMWYSLAAAQVPESVREDVVAMRDAAAEEMTAEQLAEAQRRAREWTPTREP